MVGSFTCCNAIFCLILSSMYNHNASIKEVLWIWSYMGAALALVSFKIDSRWISVMFYVLAGYFFLCIIMRRSVHYILYSTSRNGISLLMILWHYFCMFVERVIKWKLCICLQLLTWLYQFGLWGEQEFLLQCFSGVALLYMGW